MNRLQILTKHRKKLKERYLDLLNIEINRLNSYHHQKENKIFTLIIFQSAIFGALYSRSTDVLDDFLPPEVAILLFLIAWVFIHYIVSSMQQMKELAVLKSYSFQVLRLKLLDNTVIDNSKSDLQPNLPRENWIKIALLHFIPIKKIFKPPINGLETYPNFMGNEVLNNLDNKKFKKPTTQQIAYSISSFTMLILIILKSLYGS